MRAFADSDALLHLLPDEVPDACTVSAGSLCVRVAPGVPDLLLRGRALQTLLDGGLPTVTGLHFYRHCGFRWADYTEILVWLDGTGGWTADRDVPFALGDVAVRAGLASPAMCVLMTPAYWNDIEVNFELGISLRFFGSAPQDLRALLANALFYMNSHYLHSHGTSMAVQHLLSAEDIQDITQYDSVPRLQRTRQRRRAVFVDTPPLELYNAACRAYGEARFLGFYRVLEFFFSRAHLAEIERLRHDPTVTADALLKVASGHQERPQLRTLLESALTPAQRRRLLVLAERHALLPALTTVASLAEALYAFRNSVVHAKERELVRTALPNPLEPSSPVLSGWTVVVEHIAVCAIRRLIATR